MCHQGRRAGHYGECAQRRCGLLGHAHLLLRDERPDEDPHRPHERDVPQGLQVPRGLSADLRGRERGVRAEARRRRPHRLDRLLRQVRTKGPHLLRRRGGSQRDCRQRQAAGGI